MNKHIVLSAQCEVNMRDDMMQLMPVQQLFCTSHARPILQIPDYASHVYCRHFSVWV